MYVIDYFNAPGFFLITIQLIMIPAAVVVDIFMTMMVNTLLMMTANPIITMMVIVSTVKKD